MNDRERTYSSFAHHNGHNARLMHDPVCHLNHLFLDYNSRPSTLVCTSVTLASFIQLRDVVCVSYDNTAFLSNRSVCITHDEKYVLLRNRIHREVVLLFMYRLYIFLHDLTYES